ncbi:MAG: transglutaminase domain-containing protein [Gammaproteobacteria bacterium]
MTSSLIKDMRAASAFMRSTATTVLIAFTLMILEPVVAAAQTAGHGSTSNATAPTTASAEDQLSKTLQRMEDKLTRLEDKLAQQLDGTLERNDLKQLQQTLHRLDQTVRQGFRQVEQRITDQGLAAVIMERHEAMVTYYQDEYQALIDELNAIDTSADDSERKVHAQNALNRLKAKKNKRSQQPFDPNNLPFQVPDGKVRAPKETREELQQLIQAQTPVQVAALDLSAGMLAQVQTSATPQAADLAPTEDVQITDDIRALAQSLNNDPVAIYNWVRNNIEYIPTYGSIQGSLLTLANQKGNAFDTASLLIALYRAAGIPARYVYGTVQIPIEKLMNWVGGVTEPMAALELLGQGGIPNTGMAQGGVIKFVKMEHVWVEAWVDFIPSRGAKHRTGDTWVPLDASFKQYEFIPGVDIEQNRPFDSSILVDIFLQSGTIDNTLGTITGIDMDSLASGFEQAEADMKAWWTRLETEEKDSMTSKVFPNDAPSVLAASLPYQLIAVGNRFAEMPAALRAKFSLHLYVSAMDRTLNNPLLSYDISLPKLGLQRLTLGFALDSENDYQVIQGYLPAVAEGEPLPLDQLPSQLPAYLIRLVPALLLDGKVVARAPSSFQMGEDIYSHADITRVTGGTYEANNTHVVGEFLAVGIDGQGVAPQQALRRTDQNTVLGVIHEAAVAYFASLDFHQAVLNATGKYLAYRLPSFGFFGTRLTPVYRFGVPYQVGINGSQIDVDVATQSLIEVHGDKQKKTSMTAFFGLLLSAFENQIPEFYFVPKNSVVRGISAVAAIDEAMRGGQRLFMLDSSNLGAALPHLALAAEVLDDIRNSVNAGFIVITPERNVTVDGWTGVGYS